MPKHYALSLALASYILGTPAAADRVIMNNGDRLTGRVAQKDDATLTLQSPYAGEIKIPWAEVSELYTDEAVEVILSDDTSMRATITSTEPGRVELRPKSIARSVAAGLDEIIYINPPPHVSGKGVDFSGKVNLGVTVSQGNTESQHAYLDTEMVARTRSNRYTLGAIANHATENDEKTASNTTAYMKYDHFLDTTWFLYGNGTFVEDEFKDLNLRTSIGLGAGFQFRESKTSNLSLEGGLTYVNEDFIVSEDDRYSASRWAINYDQYILGQRAQFFHNHEGLLSLEDTGDAIVRSRTGLRFPFTPSLNSSLQVNADWDNSPPPGTEKTDLTYLLNVGYQW